MSGHLNYEFFFSLIKPDSRKLRDFPSLIHTDTKDADIVCWSVGWSNEALQSKTRKGERLMRLFQQTVWSFSEMTCHPFAENAYLHCMCVLPFIDSKVQLRYLEKLKYYCTFVVSVVIPLIVVEMSPISRFYDRGDKQRPWLRSLCFPTSKGDVVSS